MHHACRPQLGTDSHQSVMRGGERVREEGGGEGVSRRVRWEIYTIMRFTDHNLLIDSSHH